MKTQYRITDIRVFVRGLYYRITIELASKRGRRIFLFFIRDILDNRKGHNECTLYLEGFRIGKHLNISTKMFMKMFINTDTGEITLVKTNDCDEIVAKGKFNIDQVKALVNELVREFVIYLHHIKEEV